MNLFTKEVCIESAKSKEEVIALLRKNIALTGKDNSIAKFVGKLSDEGGFVLRLGGEYTTFNRYADVLYIAGVVVQDAGDSSQIKITFTIDTAFLYLIYFIVPFMLVLTFMAYMSILDLKMSWYGLLLSLSLFMFGFTVLFIMTEQRH